MLFDENAKEKIEDFYNRREEMERLKKGISEGRRIILVLGIRRIGKSSLVKVTLNSMNVPYIYFDVREVYIKYNYITSYGLYYALEEEFNKIVKSSIWSKIVDYLKRVRGVKVLGTGMEVEVEFSKYLKNIEPLLPQLFNALNDWAKDNEKKVVVVFDEAQYLRYSKINFRSLLAYVYDNLSCVTVVLTGSEVGLLHDLLRVNEPDSELYGRYMYEITLRKFSREQSIDFLVKGFHEYNITPPMDVIEEAVYKLDGIVGWLVTFGRICVDKGVSRDAIEETFVKGVKQVSRELKELYRRSIRYRLILEAIAYGHKTWSNIKRYLTARELKPIHDSILYSLLVTLQKMGIIEKEATKEGEIIYKIVDPVVEYTIKRGIT